ncbi:hypothetical protein BDV98DRAFT_650474 [Pterulicium gracile]|uniref:Putative gamma-glutamylcyclotransferase n=1 Tax=Pterulicium gracile TaxID=1884261 RepID=A0A5C3QGK3_9AGAR|nr:hypothetical protein BDV98DRAFT_650474 [Pterula gracilis]
MSENPRPLFVYGTLRALPLLAWALTGDFHKTDPATVSGYTRSRLHHCDYPAVVPSSPSSSESLVDGYLLRLETVSQRRKLDDFEGESLEWSVKERLEDWIEIFAGMELVG